MSLSQFAERLARHDRSHWKQSGPFETDRHNLLHVMKTAGKYATHVEEIDDGTIPPDTTLDPAIAADLIIYGLRALTNLGLDADTEVAARLRTIDERSV